MELPLNTIAGSCKAIKMSFSCSSLQRSSENLECQEQSRIKIDRPYNSLTKKRKDPSQEPCQRTWVNRDDCKDDFWAAIRSNYDYIMDTNLIDSCKEAHGELVWDEGDVSTFSWGLKEVSSQFSELYSWLSDLQELVYSKEENLLDKSLRVAHMEELRRKAYRRRLFNEQAAKLVTRAPSLKDEVAWRVDHLNAKWELVEQIMAPTVPTTNQQDVSADFDHEVKCLRKWLREMESRLQPLSFRVDWTRSELEEKSKEHRVLQKDIEVHGRIVNSVVKLGERVNKQKTDEDVGNNSNEHHQLHATIIASSLEKRWQLLYIRALEWQFHIEGLSSKIYNKGLVGCRCSSDSDDEPVTKQPRLSRRQAREFGIESDTSSCHSKPSGLTRRIASSSRRRRRRSVQPTTTSCSDSDMSSVSCPNDEESYFEDDLEQLCVIEPQLKVPRIAEKLADCSEQGDQGEEGDIEEEGGNSDDEMPPTLDPAMTSCNASDEVDGPSTKITSNTSSLLTDSPKRRKTLVESSSFNSSDRKSKNCATFYFRHRDTDSEADGGMHNNESELQVNGEESSEEEWTYTALPTENGTTEITEKRRTNVIVRLDFGESEKIKTVEYNQTAVKDMEIKEIAEDGINEEEEESKKMNEESEDETKNDIQKLILNVEKLVREEGRKGIKKKFPSFILEDKTQNNYRAKYARIKEWLKINSVNGNEEKSTSQNWQPLDSCDASGEYTTGESDVEKGSETSEDLQSSVATYRRCEGGGLCASQSISQETFNDTLINDNTQQSNNNSSPSSAPVDSSTPKVVMRTKKKSNGPRPWSVSCVFRQLNSNDSTISQFSISETALHQLVSSPPTKSVSLDATGTRRFNTSSATLLEEPGRSIRSNSLRKKKLRLRKKTFSRKSESGSDGMNQTNSGGSDVSSSNQRPVRRLDRMRSLTKPDCHRCIVSLVTHGSTISCHLHNEGHAVVSAPPPSIKLTCCTPDHSSVDNDENNSRTVINRKDIISPINGGDSDVEKNSLENNSFSEQAWDSYQEKYMSEPYSEVADVESARKLLDFGDDYRNFLDSQSDCASSLSAFRTSSPLSPPPPAFLNRVHPNLSEDSDSDTEDVQRVIEKSYKKLLVMENQFISPNGLRAFKDNMELQCVCKENIKCLQALVSTNSSSPRIEKNLKHVRGLTERWENLAHKAEEAQRASVLQREMAALHLEFRAVYERLISHEIILEPVQLLDERINQITNELAILRERKSAMLALNVSAHRLITDLGSAATGVSISLKDSIADLYRVWDETFERGNQQLCALQAVQQFTARLAELQNALKRDKDTLAVLDAALQAGATSEVASSVRDVARLLSEKQDVNCQEEVAKDETLTPGSDEKFVESGVMSLGQEGGTFSDSGISDSGSEQELSERERRLSALRRLTRTLETQLAPGSNALVELWRRVEDAEAELRSLQKQCRELIVKTAASVEAKVVARNPQVKYPGSKRKKRSSSIDLGSSKKPNKFKVASDDPEEEPSTSSSWVWRILKAALPFQLAIVALFCAACLLEPHCCEVSNSLNLSFTPQLRYLRGPPPV